MKNLRQNLYLMVIGAGVILLPFLLVEKRAPEAGRAPSQATPVKPREVEPLSNEAMIPAGGGEDISLSAEDHRQLQTVQEILTSKSDNDPRVDTELRNLSPALHRALVDNYQKMPNEDRNGRGFVVFLISRDLKTREDIEFLQSIYAEKPCMSLENCNQVSQSGDPHLSGVLNTSLVYPQMVALYQIEKKMKGELSPEQAQPLREVLRQAQNFEAPSVQKKAAELSQKF